MNELVYDPYTESGISGRTAAAASALKSAHTSGIAGVQDLGFGYADVAGELRNMNARPYFVSEIPPVSVTEGSMEEGYTERILSTSERLAIHRDLVAHNDSELVRFSECITEAESRLRTDIELAARAGGAVDWQGQSEVIAQAQREAERQPYQHAKPLMSPFEGFLLSLFVGVLLAVWGFGSLGMLAVGVLSVILAFIGTGLLFLSGTFAGMQ